MDTEEERPTDPKELQVWLLKRNLATLTQKVADLEGLVHRLLAEVETKRPVHR